MSAKNGSMAFGNGFFVDLFQLEDVVKAPYKRITNATRQ